VVSALEPVLGLVLVLEPVLGLVLEPVLGLVPELVLEPALGPLWH
jgi:hypothetical protein